MKLGKYFLTLVVVLLAVGPASTDYIGEWKPGRRTVEPEKPVAFEMMFRGGKRACVIVVGDHKPITDVYVKVYDKQSGKLVAKDDYGGDFVSAIWYPPRDAAYRIEISIVSNVYNKCYVSLK